MEAIETEDNYLVGCAINGQMGAFKKLVERHQKNAVFFAAGMVGNLDDARDLTQEAFVRAYRNLKRFNPAYPFRVWFYKILSNLCKNCLRHRRIAGQSRAMDTRAVLPAEDLSRPDIVFEQRELHSKIWKSVAALPEKFREIIILCHFQDASYEEMSRILDIPRGSVMSRLYYARLKLREILKQEGIEL